MTYEVGKTQRKAAKEENLQCIDVFNKTEWNKKHIFCM